MIKRPNVSCRFLLAHCLALLFFSSVAHAGYYARLVTVTGSAPYYVPAIGSLSKCYLTVGMAIAGLAGGGSDLLMVDTIDSTNNVFSAHFLGYGSISGSWGICTASALGGPLPSFSGAVIDPAISGNQINGGISSSGPFVDTTALQSQIAALQSQVTTLSTANTGLSAQVSTLTAAAAVANAPYDYLSGGSIFAAVLIATLSLYLMARAAMEIVRIVRSARRI